jgi:hypothetical protein
MIQLLAAVPAVVSVCYKDGLVILIDTVKLLEYNFTLMDQIPAYILILLMCWLNQPWLLHAADMLITDSILSYHVIVLIGMVIHIPGG